MLQECHYAPFRAPISGAMFPVLQSECAMPSIVFNPALPGQRFLSSSAFDGGMQMPAVTHSATQLTLSDGDLISYIGSGFSYQMSGGQVVGITGGTLTSIRLTSQDASTTYLNWRGLNLSASSFSDALTSRDWAALNQLMFGGADSISMTNSNDAARGFGGNDVIHGLAGKDQLLGDSGHDKLFGDSGADRLNGGSGADTLTGGTGIDTLTGGAGADAFVFNARGFANHDIVTDFRAIDDALHFDNDAFTAFSYTGQLRAAHFVAGTAAGDSNDRFIYQKSTGNLWYDADGSGAGAKTLVAELADGTALTAADIFIF